MKEGGGGGGRGGGKGGWGGRGGGGHSTAAPRLPEIEGRKAGAKPLSWLRLHASSDDHRHKMSLPAWQRGLPQIGPIKWKIGTP